ncbi:amidohydrolase family protein [Microlunatus soli]|uniref:Amidohydrolase n=1 Tax=Microlunatus soli TaxID=630515 RepID=A0A1H1ZJ26_9ACTN|nr:amidohydrolase family protein [Microlunatus soli]SDT33674.1 Amidohydrolase [Microlunatus soli]
MTDDVDRYFSSAGSRAADRSGRRDLVPESGIVDHQFHWYPRRYLDLLAGRRDYPRVEVVDGGARLLELDGDLTQPAVETLSADIDDHLSQAATAGIGQIVVGPATLGEILHLDPAEATELLSVLHQEYADAQARHPGRVAALAALPMQDAGAALKIMDQAIGELGLRGVSLLTANEGRPLVDEDVIAVYRQIAEHDVPIFLHPAGRAPLRAHARGFRQQVGLGWVYQTAAAALEIIDSGLLDLLPQLQFVHPHLGGVLPYVVGRVSPIPGSRAAQPIEHYLRHNFFVDTAAQTPAALSTAIATYGLDRIVFASDHPFIPMTQMRALIEDQLTGTETTAIYANRVGNLRYGE